MLKAATTAQVRQRLQQSLPKLPVRRLAARLHVVVVPPAFEKADTFDGVHPNPIGQAKMARAWYAALHG